MSVLIDSNENGILAFNLTCSLSTVTFREKRIRNISDSTSRFSRSSIFFALSNEVSYTQINFKRNLV